jgi:hypothetical protein
MDVIYLLNPSKTHLERAYNMQHYHSKIICVDRDKDVHAMELVIMMAQKNLIKDFTYVAGQMKIGLDLIEASIKENRGTMYLWL